jgi:riboflavin biosynthesis pyrimidine reductase
MPDTTAGTQLTLLTADGRGLEDGDDALAALYDYPPDLERCWVRGNMIASLDGGATDDGKSGGLAGPGDRTVFTLMRHAADVILVGAATVRVENYSGAQLPVSAREARRCRGQAEVPPIAIVTNSGSIDHDAKVFTRTEVPPLILTSAQHVGDVTARLGTVAEVVDASGPDPDNVDPAAMLTVLADRGLYRVLAEGGPHLLGQLIADDLLDELCLTIAPVLVGGDASRIVSGPGAGPTRLRRAHLLSDADGYLYSRYVRGDR